ncbi:MAG: S8 family serine peptidase [Clostridiales bacterium]|jgi:alpha-tubulin suppressor-like RCC1 family protein|nr:S8 family serine peptidase [Clostridiales bacterium]
MKQRRKQLSAFMISVMILGEIAVYPVFADSDSLDSSAASGYETQFNELEINDAAAIDLEKERPDSFAVTEFTEEEKDQMHTYIDIEDDFAPDTVIVGLKARPSVIVEELNVNTDVAAKEAFDEAKASFLSDTPIVTNEAKLSSGGATAKSVSISNDDEDDVTNEFLGVQLSNIKSLTEFGEDNSIIEYNDTSEFDIVDSDKIIALTLKEPGKQNVIDAIDALNDNPFVAYATPDYYMMEEYGVSEYIPSDYYPSIDAGFLSDNPGYTASLALDAIKMPYVWSYAAGDPESRVKVAVIDNGFDMSHPELANITQDSSLRKDFADDDNDPSPLPSTIAEYYHGTAVAGILGAKWNNNISFTGVAPNVEIVPLKVRKDSGSGFEASAVVSAIAFANNNNIEIINFSGGWQTTNADEDKAQYIPVEDAINSYKGLMVVAAGNTLGSIDAYDNIKSYPSSFDCDNLISVAATAINPTNKSETFYNGGSNYGSVSVDLAAPGKFIYGPRPNNRYGIHLGASYAAPMVTGVAALIKAYNPELTTAEIKKAILDSVDVMQSLNGIEPYISKKVLTGGRLNAQRALDVARTTHPRVAAGKDFSLAINPNGTVSTWGSNTYGQLGNGASGNGTTSSDTAQPQTVTGLKDVIAIAGGAEHSLALQSNGTVAAWGRNNYGQLGDMTTTDQTAPVTVQKPHELFSIILTPLNNILKISAFGDYSLALYSNGDVYAWGRNDYGQLGDDYTTYRSQAMKVIKPSGVSFVDIAAGGDFSLALSADGQVYGWGRNDFNKISSSSETNIYEATAIAGLSDIVEIAAGAGHGLALQSGGAVLKSFGQNASGQLGKGNLTAYTGTQTVDTTLVASSGVVIKSISASVDHNLSLDSAGYMWTWGKNDSLQLGYNTKASTITYKPKKITQSNGSDIGTISAGQYHNLAIINEGDNLFSDIYAYAWGNNSGYALGAVSPSARVTMGRALTFSLEKPTSFTVHLGLSSAFLQLSIAIPLWNPPYDDAFYDVSYKKASATDWKIATFEGSEGILIIPDTGSYQFRARTRKNGVFSNWSVVLNRTLA